MRAVLATSSALDRCFVLGHDLLLSHQRRSWSSGTAGLCRLNKRAQLAALRACDAGHACAESCSVALRSSASSASLAPATRKPPIDWLPDNIDA
jgi:hypothetical protein